MVEMKISHVCLECGFEGYVETTDKKIICPTCGTMNDWWLIGETPPINHQ